MPFFSSLPTVDPQSVVDGAKLWSGPGYIDGLQMQWVSATAVTVSSGRAYIPSLGYYLDAPNAISLTGLALAASTFYHLYLYNNAGTPALECVTTAPAAPYSGTARAKTGDTSRRYIGSVLTDASANIYNFTHLTLAGSIRYLTSIFAAPFQVVNGTASVPTSVSCAGVIPVTGKNAALSYANNDTVVTVLLGNSISPPNNSAIAFLSQLGKVSTLDGEIPVDGSQAFQYTFVVAPTSNFIARVRGYYYER